MPRFCAVVGCSNRAGRDEKSLYRIPSAVNKVNPELSLQRRKKWLGALKREDLTKRKEKYLWICEEHFIAGKPAHVTDVRNPDWVPSQKLGYSIFNRKTNEAITDRYERVNKRNLGKQDASTQTDMGLEDISNLENLIENYISDVRNLRESVRVNSLSACNFEKDDDKVKYYTGLVNYGTFLVIFNLISPSLHVSSALSKFQMVLLTLMHLRLNLEFKDLGFRFNVAVSTVSRTFQVCLRIMFNRLRSFIVWPERHILTNNMPQCFQAAFGNRVTAIIDCFEIFIERPANLMSSATCWSNYKHHHTIKVLIGISPQGFISFISEAWGGRVSDKHITENSGILDLLLPGDLVLADRGFHISDSFNLYGAEVVLPAFTHGKKQLSAVEVESTRKLANVRIHVERVIGSLRQKFKILHGTLPISLISKSSKEGVSTIDQIITVCCALTNMCPSVIPTD